MLLVLYTWGNLVGRSDSDERIVALEASGEEALWAHREIELVEHLVELFGGIAAGHEDPVLARALGQGTVARHKPTILIERQLEQFVIVHVPLVQRVHTKSPQVPSQFTEHLVSEHRVPRQPGTS